MSRSQKWFLVLIVGLWVILASAIVDARPALSMSFVNEPMWFVNGTVTAGGVRAWPSTTLLTETPTAEAPHTLLTLPLPRSPRAVVNAQPGEALSDAPITVISVAITGTPFLDRLVTTELVESPLNALDEPAIIAVAVGRRGGVFLDAAAPTTAVGHPTAHYFGKDLAVHSLASAPLTSPFHHACTLGRC